MEYIKKKINNLNLDSRSMRPVNFFEQMAIKKGSQIVNILPDVYKHKSRDKPKENHCFKYSTKSFAEE